MGTQNIQAAPKVLQPTGTTAAKAPVMSPGGLPPGFVAVEPGRPGRYQGYMVDPVTGRPVFGVADVTTGKFWRADTALTPEERARITAQLTQKPSGGGSGSRSSVSRATPPGPQIAAPKAPKKQIKPEFKDPAQIFAAFSMPALSQASLFYGDLFTPKQLMWSVLGSPYWTSILTDMGVKPPKPVKKSKANQGGNMGNEGFNSQNLDRFMQRSLPNLPEGRHLPPGFLGGPLNWGGGGQWPTWNFTLPPTQLHTIPEPFGGRQLPRGLLGGPLNWGGGGQRPTWQEVVQRMIANMGGSSAGTSTGTPVNTIIPTRLPDNFTLPPTQPTQPHTIPAPFGGRQLPPGFLGGPLNWGGGPMK